MPNIEVSKPSQAPTPRRPDIFEALRSEMDRAFSRFEYGWPRWPSLLERDNGGFGLVPDLDVREDARAITVEAELPGVDEKDISVTLANGILTIKGEKKHEREEKAQNYCLSERSFGSFERSLKMPDTIDDSKIEARFDKGVLKVTAAKKPEAVKAEKKIEVKKG